MEQESGEQAIDQKNKLFEFEKRLIKGRSIRVIRQRLSFKNEGNLIWNGY